MQFNPCMSKLVCWNVDISCINTHDSQHDHGTRLDLFCGKLKSKGVRSLLIQPQSEHAEQVDHKQHNTPVIYTQCPPCPFTAQTQSCMQLLSANKGHVWFVDNTSCIWWLNQQGAWKDRWSADVGFIANLVGCLGVRWWLIIQLSWQNLAMKHCLQVNMLCSKSKFLRQSSINPVHLAPPIIRINSLVRTKWEKRVLRHSAHTHTADWLGLC